MTWLAEAPANIALVKYMGKSSRNTPLNSSLSYTLNRFLTRVELQVNPAGDADQWEPFSSQSKMISIKDQEKFFKHLDFLRSQFQVDTKFIIRSDNNFPSHCGLASSASSFAALTMCASKALSEIAKISPPSVEVQSEWSRQGSGSSCRSFFSPWALWQKTRCIGMDLPYKNLFHQVIVVNSEEKKVSSSEAHKRVPSSALWQGRVERAESRLSKLLEAFDKKQWRECYELVWSEFWDMHALFHTSVPHFRYMSEQSLSALEKLEKVWENSGDGPLITMDAGPNIHILYREDQFDLMNKTRQEVFKNLRLLGDECGQR